MLLKNSKFKQKSCIIFIVFILSLVLSMLFFSISLAKPVISAEQTNKDTLNTILLNYNVIEDANEEYISCLGELNLSKEAIANFDLYSVVPKDVNNILFKVNNISFVYKISRELKEGDEALNLYELFNKNNVSLKDKNEIKITFISHSLLKNKEFFNIIKTDNLLLNSLTIKFVLPKGAILTSENRFGKSIFPTPTTYKTDGERITAVWEYKENIPTEIAFYLNYNIVDKSPIYLIPLLFIFILIIFVFTILFFVFFIRQKQNKEIKIKIKNNKTNSIQNKKSSKKGTKRIKPKKEQKVIINNIKTSHQKQEENDKRIFSHLKEEEKQIYNILKEREGVCEQGTLVIISDFSKAKLSRILMEMEERKIIKKVKKGKKNLIYLR